MRLKISSLLAVASLLCGQALPRPRLRMPIFAIAALFTCVSGQVNTFNPQKVSSGLIVDTLAAQLYDRLLDVDPYTYRLVPELAESWEVLDNGATYRFHLRSHVPFQSTAWFKPTAPLTPTM
jgi:cationic peptide transport system substrate-binding protein